MQKFIKETLETQGYVSRADVCVKYGLSPIYGSIALLKFRERFPASMNYNKQMRRFEWNCSGK